MKYAHLNKKSLKNQDTVQEILKQIRNLILANLLISHDSIAFPELCYSVKLVIKKFLKKGCPPFAKGMYKAMYQLIDNHCNKISTYRMEKYNIIKRWNFKL